MGDVGSLVDALTARLRPLEIAANKAWWLSSTAVSDEHERRRVATDVAVRDALGDVSAFAQVRDALAAPETASTAGTRRQLEVLHDRCLPQQLPADLRAELVELEAQVDATFNAFRGRIDGDEVDDNTIVGILRTSDDAGERQRAWEASKQVGAEVADRVLELARLRNRAAHHLGSRDHFTLALATSELDESRLFATLDEVDRATAEPFHTWKGTLDETLAARFRGTADELRPWHYDDPFFQDPPIAGSVSLDPWLEDADLDQLTVRTYDGLGLDLHGVLARSDLLPRAGKSQHAFCIDIDHEGDVRVLSNNRPSEYWAGTMLHEFGHALYDTYVDRDLPWLLRTMHPLTTEGVAMLFGRLVHDVEWLDAVAGVGAGDLDELAPRLDLARRASLLTFARWVLVMTHFERGLYADPEADHTSRWWELVERFQGVRRPGRRAEPDWAAKIHVALAPVYYQNYLYGELVASQLQATLRDRAGGIVDRPAAGAVLVDELFAPGLALRWDALVTSVTGEPLSARHLAAELRGLTAMCDTLAIVGTEGTLFAKNSDRPPHEVQVVEALPRRAGGGSLATQYLTIPDTGANALLGSRPTWLWGCEHGVNEHRVAIGNEKVWTTDDAHAAAPALLGMDLVRLALERGATADDALETLTSLLAEHGQGGSGEQDHDEPYFSSFLIADPHGGWVVETSARTWAARPVGNGAAISNRVSLGTDWTRASPDVAPGRDFQDWRDPSAPTGIADARLAATQGCVARADSRDHTTIGPADLVATLRDHGTGPWGAPGSAGPTSPVPTEVDADWNGVTVCMHVGDYQATTASMVASLPADPGAPVRAWVALGSPCASVYLPTFPAAAPPPPPLALPDTWRRFAALARRVESDHDALDAVRAVLALVEAQLWEDADHAYGRGTPAALAEFTTGAWGPLEDALVRLGV